jgi:tRNA (guanine-N(7)-)-methyltransferase subunit TRM82
MAMSYYHPIQKLCYIDQSHGGEFLLAATGPYILSLDLKHGGVLSKWPDDAQALENPSNGGTHGRPIDDESPRKRRKVSPSQRSEEQESRESSVSIEFVSERARGQRRRKKKIVQSILPNVSQIISTTDGRHAIAVTADDKCIRVFDIGPLGRLRPLSERKETHVFGERDYAYCGADVCQRDYAQ